MTLVVHKDKAIERLALCKACPHIKRRPANMLQCDRCGCMMNIKVKISNAKCPLGKW